MRNLAIIAALCAPLLAGCAIDPTTGQPTGVTIPSITLPTITVSPGVGDAVNQVINGVRTACGFETTVDSVASILSSLAGAPGIGDIVDMATTGICNAVKSSTASARRGLRHAPTYRGVRIVGHFVR